MKSDDEQLKKIEEHQKGLQNYITAKKSLNALEKWIYDNEFDPNVSMKLVCSRPFFRQTTTRDEIALEITMDMVKTIFQMMKQEVDASFEIVKTYGTKY